MSFYRKPQCDVSESYRIGPSTLLRYAQGERFSLAVRAGFFDTLRTGYTRRAKPKPERQSPEMIEKNDMTLKCGSIPAPRQKCWTREEFQGALARSG